MNQCVLRIIDNHKKLLTDDLIKIVALSSTESFNLGNKELKSEICNKAKMSDIFLADEKISVCVRDDMGKKYIPAQNLSIETLIQFYEECFRLKTTI